MNEPSLSERCLAAAEAINAVRRQLVDVVKNGHFPIGTFGDCATVLVNGLTVANALQRIANDDATKEVK